MIIEGRTITTLAELKEFADAAIALAKVDPTLVRLSLPMSLRLCETNTGGHNKLYDILPMVERH
jgi:hypothetical protein